MKKKLLLIVILCMIIIPLRVHAQSSSGYDGIICTYQVKCKNKKGEEYNVGRYTFLYTSKGIIKNQGLYKLRFTGDSDSKTISSIVGEVKLNTDFTNYTNVSNFDKLTMKITSDDGTGKGFNDLVNSSGTCPKMHCTTTDKTMYLSPGNAYGSMNGKNYYDVVTEAVETSLCKNEENAQCSIDDKTGNWKTTTKSSDLSNNCDYSLVPRGQKDKLGIQSSDENEKVDVTFTTIYETNGSPSNYIIKLNGEEHVVDINKEFTANFNGKKDKKTYGFGVTSDTMKTLFTDKCYDKDLYLYFTVQGGLAPYYILTTSAEEASKNMVDTDGRGKIKMDELPISDDQLDCKDLLKEPLLSIIKGGLTILQILAAIITIVKGMMLFIPAVIAKDADALKKSSKQLAILGVILTLVIIFRPIIVIIGKLLEYDISCII